MIGIGLNHGEINSSAAIFKNGQILAAVPEERFTREKKTMEFPQKSIEFCLLKAGIDFSKCDFIAQAWNPGAGWHKHQNIFQEVRLRREGYFYSLPDHLFKLNGNRGIIQDYTLMTFPQNEIPPLYYVQHHKAHAANAFFLSEFEEAAILTVDFRGEFECASMSYGKSNSIKLISSQMLPNSLGMFYATYTQLLGYRPDNDEWKVMALSAFDVECTEYYNKIKSTVKLLNNGYFELDQSYYKGIISDQPNLYTQKLVDMFGGKIGYPREEITEWHLKIAKAMQKLSEEIAFHMMQSLFEKTKCKNLVLGGGFFMNSVLNGKIEENTKFKNVYISHSPADVGNSLGAALYIAHCVLDEPRKIQFSSSYLGPEYSNDEIESSLNRRKILFRHVEDWPDKIADLLTKGEVVALMHGKMEFGERALGNRSILGDPRDLEIKNKINSMIKYREAYRPFAPVTLYNKSHELFNVPEKYECPYMEKVIPVKEEYYSNLPAITHEDGSGRLQVVHKNQNKEFYRLIEKFADKTGIPVVLNTSFNINGEPIVCSPDDALNTFFNSGLEHLFIEGYYIKK